jgi:hypothetical protein
MADPFFGRGRLIGPACLVCALLGWANSAAAGPDPCTTAGSTLTCSGNQSQGVTAGAPYIIVDVIDLTDADADGVAIEPANNVDGIRISTNTSVTLTSNTGLSQSGPQAPVTGLMFQRRPAM